MLIAILQMTPAPADIEANLACIERAATAAAAFGCDLLVTPEMGVTGYNIDADIARLASPSDGPLVARLGEIAQRAGMCLVAGFPERAGDAVYNSLVLVRPAGGAVIYRKCHLYGPDEKAAFTASSRVSEIVDIAGLKVGFLICYDVEFPEMVQALALAGADLVVVPTALAATPSCRRIALSVVPARAMENHVFIAYADLCGSERGLTYQGCSVIAAPDGEDLARAGEGEALLMARIDPRAYDAARAENPYSEDRRPTLYAARGT
ncbi:carbon-nitrogen hydrolase family protein [Xanthobacter sp. DSM 24535]|uniref:carbon-nitrogen hydrolase family protein n=1 Tax=Roseixanthobacter psychrophilus TaxID=3119917 RepID=UPI0037282F54